MKKITITIAFFGLLIFALAIPVRASFIVWNKTYGGADTDLAEEVIQTSDGGYAFVGSTRSFSADGNEFWLVKTDSLGNMEWNNTYGSGMVSSVLQTSDGGYTFAGGARLVKTDSEGNMQWTKNYGGGETVNSIIQTSDGGYALAGRTDFDSAWTTDFWFAKTDELGNMQWNRTYDWTTTEWVNSVIQTSDGGYALIGVTTLGGGMTHWKLIKTDSEGNMEWNKGYGSIDKDEGHAVIQTGDGGYMLGGWMWSRSNGGGPTFALVKTDSVGNMIWNKTYDGGTAWSMVQTSDGGYALAGGVKLVKTDSEGNMQWSQIYSRHDSFNSVIQTSDGGYVLAGTIIILVDDIPYDNNAWLIKTDVEGIIPEFSSLTPLLIMAVAAVALSLTYRRKLQNRWRWEK